MRRNDTGHSASGLMMKRFTAYDTAKLLRPVVACNSAREREQSLAIAASENHAPSMTQTCRPSVLPGAF